jgi:hypothetical protein
MEKKMRAWLLTLVMMVCAGLASGADKPPPALTSDIKGKVLEVTDVASYTYLRLKTKDGEIWAAVGRVPVKVGSEVTIKDAAVMENFESKTLNKKFDRIVFGSVAGTGTNAAAGNNLAALHAGVAKAVDVEDVKVTKAVGPDARTVAEINSRKADFKDKVVLVRAKVVKFTPEVMGKNWIHLRDGSGSAADGTNDILVTTTDKAKIGDVVLVRGVVHTDRDLGSGYSYKVLVEEATLQK